MNFMACARLSRRDFLKTGGALIVSFSLGARTWPAAPEGAPKSEPQLPGSLKKAPLLDSWIRIGADNSVTVITGKAELGQGIKTALIQVAAEELFVDPARIRLITADTQQTPNEGYTAGSQSMSESGTALLNAAAQVRGILTGLAAARLNQPAEHLVVENGTIRTQDGRSSVTYGQLVAGETLHVAAQPVSPLTDPRTRRVMGKAMQRVDIPSKVTGGVSYVHDLRLPQMVHGRVVRPRSPGARLRSVDTAKVEKLPGVLKIVRNGNYLAVIAEHEYQAIVAMRALARAAAWDKQANLPGHGDVYQQFQRLPAEEQVILGDQTEAALGPAAIEARYTRPYQMHASIGPSCAVALARDEQLTVWSHMQGAYPLRDAIAEMLHMPAERVRCIHVEGSGCYGHNGADDAGADAALLAVALPGRPVRVQWMRDDEHTCEPYGSMMVSHAKARVDDGRIVDWQYEVWSNTHSTRPAPAGNLMPAWHIENGFTPPPPKDVPLPAGVGHRNAIPYYKFPNPRVAYHFVTAMPLRVSALRALGAYMNVFSIESFMDELAKSARADPVAFRLRHLEDLRAQDVLNLAAERFGWLRYARVVGRGRGIAFARYKNHEAYAAVACEAEVDRNSGRVHVLRAVAAVDSGETVNPDGIRNQIEGGIIQSMSWTLFEAVTFDDTRITSRDWSTYPIMRFSSVPDRIDVHIINRLGMPFLGTGEAVQGPAAAALANAIADATGVRVRDLPLTPDRIRASVGV
ncbi:MAG TPA: molybdopterin cofactor-binding domain-containing protein [Burkholderiales bacterium]|nr:molybdopterin cofactor-binding domain-containing protein [Burkholderiales bacterium]